MFRDIYAELQNDLLYQSKQIFHARNTYINTAIRFI